MKSALPVPACPVAPDPSVPSYFVAGGTLPRNAPCYVRRASDEELFNALRRADFCYVLTARQMGKSSLMVQAATRLRQIGATVALLDLTAVGQNLSPTQWYRGMLGRLGRQLNVEDELDERWEARAGLGALQRWTETLADVLLDRFPGPIVVCVDEIDAVRSLPFPTDEFFGAIRECYNRRADNPDFRRLTFCLVGVATPSELVRDTRHTPFNIGRRIELNDFTRDEVMALAPGFADSGASPATTRRLLERIHYWTGGHPYLTQRLCHAAVEAGATGAGEIDRLCAELFFGKALHNRDNNLLFVQDRLLRSSPDVAATLDLYQEVLAGKPRIEGEGGDPAAQLRLAGIVRIDPRGVMRPRNRVYRHVFNRAWVQAYLPGPELRRQRVAFQRGLVRALSLSSAGFLVMGYVGYRLLQSERRAVLAESGVRQQLFVSDMNLTGQSLTENHVARALQLLTAHRDAPHERDRFEWRHLWSRCHTYQARFLEPTDGACAVAFPTGEGDLISARAADLSVRVWQTGRDKASRQLAGIPLTGDNVDKPRAAFSPNATLLARCYRRSCDIVNLATGRTQKMARTGGADLMASPAFSRDGRWLLTGDFAGTVRLWDAATGREIRVYRAPGLQIAAVSLSPDNRTLAVSGFDGSVVLWKADAPEPKRRFRAHPDAIQSLHFSPDGKRLATGGRDGVTRLWDATPDRPTDQPLVTLNGHTAAVTDLEFSPDGRLLATASADQTARLWHVDSGKTARVIRGHTSRIAAIAFSPDGKWLATAGQDGMTALWDAIVPPEMFRFAPGRDTFTLAAAVPAGDALVALEDGHRNLILRSPRAGRDVRIPLPTQQDIVTLSVSWDGLRFCAVDAMGVALLGETDNGTPPLRVAGHGDAVSTTAYSPDDRYLAIGTATGSVWLRDARTGESVRQVTLPTGVGVSALAIAPDARQLAVGSMTGTIHRIDVPTGRTFPVFQAHDGLIGEMTYSPDGRQLATGGFDALIHLWPLMATNPATAGQTLAGHAGRVYALVFSPDGHTLASGGFDGVTRLWDVASARETLRFPSPDVSDQILSLRFDRPGNALTTVYRNGQTIRRTAPPANRFRGKEEH